jgi:hypothetical protein
MSRDVALKLAARPKRGYVEIRYCATTRGHLDAPFETRPRPEVIKVSVVPISVVRHEADIETAPPVVEVASPSWLNDDATASGLAFGTVSNDP